MQPATNVSAIEKILPTLSGTSSGEAFVPTQAKIDLFQKNIRAPQTDPALQIK